MTRKKSATCCSLGPRAHAQERDSVTCPASPDGLWNTHGGKLMLSKTQWIGYMQGEVVDIDGAAEWKIFTWPIFKL